MSQPIPTRAKIFAALTTAVGAAALGTTLTHWHSNDLLQFVCYFAIAVLASTMKIRLPGMESTMSVHFLFVLLSVMDLSLGEALVIGCSAALVQSVWKATHRPEVIKVMFNLGMSATAIWVTYYVYHYSAVPFRNNIALMVVSAGCTYFLGNTLPVSTVIALSEGKSLRGVWVETFFWSFPYYLLGASVAGFVSILSRSLGWSVALLTVPFLFGIFKSYQMYLNRLDEKTERIKLEKKQVVAEKRHVEEVCALHLRTIEGLALAIDAKDHTTHQHLHRVRTYVEEIGKELGLSTQESDALRAAALLHDIGKLAVPDHIINKPGRLTSEEFEKMKIHPVVGADILERVAFPYPVSPIVRAHHEKWNGKGYPDGLKGEDIPLGARILSAVDCLDALASDRQYRKALPLDEAMKVVVEESGRSFDPKIVEILQRRYVELESLAVRTLAKEEKTSIKSAYHVERGERPGTGIEVDHAGQQANQSDFLSSIASARHEAYTLFELSQELGNSLSLDETLSLVGIRLKKLVPYDSIAVFTQKGNCMVPEFVNGEDSRLLSSLSIPVGAGLSGWVAQNMKPIVNGNPEVESDFASGSRGVMGLRSALAVPLEGFNGLVGVLVLYRIDRDAFTADHLRVLNVITSKVAHFIENALKYRLAENSAHSDFLTGLPNARGLSEHLERELARCSRDHETLTIMVCDLNGFKQVNDHYGHLVGDEILRTFASCIQHENRRYDYVARMGGDEFVIIAPGMPCGAAGERAFEIDAMAKKAGIKVCGEDVLSASIGMAFYPQNGADAAQLLAEADNRMYEAKASHYRWREPVSSSESVTTRTLRPAHQLSSKPPVLN